MKKILLFAFCVLSYSCIAQQWDWAIHENPSKIAVDSAGNFFTCRDSILKKFNPQGILTWQKHLSGIVSVSGMTADNAGNVYIAATFTDFTLDANHFTAIGQRDAFLGKIDSFGNLLWFKITADIKNDYMNDVFVDSRQKILVCGGNKGDSFSIPELYVARYSVEGTLELQTIFTGGDAWEISADTSGNIYILGGIGETTQINFGNGIILGPGGEMGEHFIAKINSFGTLLWAKNLGSNYYEPHQNLGVDREGNFSMTQWDRYSGFTLTKWNSSGNFSWGRDIDGTYGDCYSLCVDNNDIIWLAGYIWKVTMFKIHIYGNSTPMENWKKQLLKQERWKVCL